MKGRAMGAEGFHADRLTDRHDEANSCLKQPVDNRPDS
jgi:hypothetical protein